MGSETSLWNTMRRNVKEYGEFDRHEDKLNLGVPDVSYCLYGGRGTGWIELKHVHSYPARPDTVFKIKHYTKEQRNWLRRRGRAGDRCWLLLQVGRDYYLFDWHGAQEVNRHPWAGTVRYVVRSWVGHMDWYELVDIIGI